MPPAGQDSAAVDTYQLFQVQVMPTRDLLRNYVAHHQFRDQPAGTNAPRPTTPQLSADHL
jgi:hypothetical protein